MSPVFQSSSPVQRIVTPFRAQGFVRRVQIASGDVARHSSIAAQTGPSCGSAESIFLGLACRMPSFSFERRSVAAPGSKRH